MTGTGFADQPNAAGTEVEDVVAPALESDAGDEDVGPAQGRIDLFAHDVRDPVEHLALDDRDLSGAPLVGASLDASTLHQGHALALVHRAAVGPLDPQRFDPSGTLTAAHSVPCRGGVETSACESTKVTSRTIHTTGSDLSMTTLLAVLILLNIATLFVGWRLFRRTGVSDETEVQDAVERSKWLLEMEAKERWAALDLERLHPVNREEVETLLARMEGASTHVLSTSERAFLDRMVEAEQRASRPHTGGRIGLRRLPAG